MPIEPRQSMLKAAYPSKVGSLEHAYVIKSGGASAAV
jgi:hypothetical protein